MNVLGFSAGRDCVWFEIDHVCCANAEGIQTCVALHERLKHFDKLVVKCECLNHRPTTALGRKLWAASLKSG